MKIISSLPEIAPLESHFKGIGLTIGNFDGCHRGHQELLKNLSHHCHRENLGFVVISFRPHPKKILFPETKNFLIQSYDDKRTSLSKLGVDYFVELKFSRDFSTQSPEDFLSSYILNFEKVKKIYMGHDFAFGENKKGDFDFLKKYCEEKNLNISVELQPRYQHDGEYSSSSQIRSYIRNGEMEKSSSLLGRDFYIKGIVVKGEGMGKKIGFPTANIRFPTEVIVPPNGVYTTKTTYKGIDFNSITNVGVKPTFGERDQPNIETHILDFDSDIYGEEIKVSFKNKIRDEKKFEGVNKLIEQIAQDVNSVREFYSRD